MFQLHANKTQLIRKQREPVTSGSVNVYQVCFQFSEDWDGLSRTAIFRAGAESRAVLLDESGECTIPWEVLQKPNLKLFCGVYGTAGEHTVLPTIWADLGTIHEGAFPGNSAQPPAPIPSGAADHRELSHRDAAEQHPIGAIAGLEEELSRIPEPTEALTNSELEEMLK